MRPEVVSGIVTGDVPVSYWSIFLLPVSSNSSQKSLWKLTRSSLPLVFIVANGSHVTCQHSLSIVPYFLLEPAWNREKITNFSKNRRYYVVKITNVSNHYCAFHKHANSEVQKQPSQLRFSLPSIILTDLLGNKTLLKRVQKVKVCDLWLVDFDPFCVFLCFQVRCLWS